MQLEFINYNNEVLINSIRNFCFFGFNAANYYMVAYVLFLIFFVSFLFLVSTSNKFKKILLVSVMVVSIAFLGFMFPLFFKPLDSEWQKVGLSSFVELSNWLNEEQIQQPTLINVLSLNSKVNEEIKNIKDFDRKIKSLNLSKNCSISNKEAIIKMLINKK